MDSLLNLAEFKQQLSEKISKLDLSDYELPDSFKTIFKSFGEYRIEEYYKYTIKVSSKKSVCYIPNQWVYIAAICSEYCIELKKYKQKLMELGITDDDFEACHPSTSDKSVPAEKRASEFVSQKAAELLSSYDGEDKDLLVSFLWDYESWGGGKNIKRDNDFTVSPCLNVANSINSSSSLIGDISKAIGDNPTFFSSIWNSAEMRRVLREKDAGLSNGDNPIQHIFYGTPGSGKSHKVKEKVESIYPEETIREEYVFRTTFHPDSDYASFVGCYKPQMDGTAIKYEFTPQAFTKAYTKAWKNPQRKVFLIIEEINRGNCAQIFGDLFQLLDRDQGISEYPINADADLRQYLEKELGEGNAGIKEGKLTLPSNLYIWATMNTSDQSLFPMDSAFKRRWTWECVPIDYNHPRSSTFSIYINNEKYAWPVFLKEVNARIKSATDSEDKQMGDFFIKSDVDERQFIDKVMFYLWNDICKEEYKTKNNFFRIFSNDTKTESVEFTFSDLFDKSKNEDNKLLVGFMEYLGQTPMLK